jgi:hypothetical protein
MKLGDYFYEVQFKDGRFIRRERMTKSAALAVFNAFTLEMIELGVYSVSWGKMR